MAKNPVNAAAKAVGQAASQAAVQADPLGTWQSHGGDWTDVDRQLEMERAAAARELATPQAPAGPAPEDPNLAWARQQEDNRRASVSQAVSAAFAMYGLGSLTNLIDSYARQGLNDAAIALQLRQTPEYKARFPAMEALSKEGRAISEGEYIGYERAAAQLEQQYGLPKDMLLNNVTDLLINDLSIAELQNRVQLAAADSLYAPEDLRATIRDYYGIDPDQALTAYYLDPDIAVPLLEQQSAAARIGTQGYRQGLGADQGLNRGFAETLAQRGVTEQQAQQGFGQAAAQQSFTYGRGDTATGAEVLSGAFGDQAAQQAVQRAAQARGARFQGGGNYAGNQRGNRAIGSSSA